jgi:hypothetical protein
MVLLEVPREGRFLMSEVPLHPPCLLGLTDYSPVDMQGERCKPVYFGAGKARAHEIGTLKQTATELGSGPEEDSHLRLIDLRITQPHSQE